MKRTCCTYGILLALTLLVSCNKMETAGDLAGNWQLTSMTDNTTGEVKADKTSQMFYTVKRELLQMHRYSTDPEYTYACLCRYEHRGDSLILTEAYENHSNTDSLVAFTYLHKYGVTDDGRFRIVTLDGDNLVLRNAENTLSFRKY